MFLGMNPASVTDTMAFAQIYCGPGNSCAVLQKDLASAYIDTTSKPAIIFKIAAKNDKG